MTIGLTNYLGEDDSAEALRADVRNGLTAPGKFLPPTWFYDAHGSDLFDRITRLPEYYPTRAERSILQAHADPIARLTGADTLVELGSGTSEKTRLLLTALTASGTLRRFVPFDVDPTVLQAAGNAVVADYPGVEVHAVIGDFTRHLKHLRDVPGVPGDARRLVAFLGSTIGNLEPDARADFLASVAAGLEPGDHFLLGTDLVKDPTRLVRAYDDSAGVTAEFNRNVLSVINHELGADFDLTAFDHVAVWDQQHEWIEMRLRSVRDQTVHIPALPLDVRFAAGEVVRTEISAKFRQEGVEAELAVAGLRVEQWWTDADGDVGLTLATLSA